METNQDKLCKLTSLQGAALWFPIIFLVFTLYLCWLILSPFLDALILAMVLAAVASPLNRRLRILFRGKDTLAAGITLLVTVLAIVLPMVFFVSALVNQANQNIAQVTEWAKHTDIDQFLKDNQIDHWIQVVNQNLPFAELTMADVQKFVLGASQKLGQKLLSSGTFVLGNVASFLMNFVIMTMVAFFMMLEGRLMLSRVKYFLPMREDQVEAIVRSLRNVSKAVLLGGLLVALAQGIVGGIGLALVGIPGVFWGTMMGFSSLVPVVGTALVWVPAVIYLFVMVSWQKALFLAAWNLLIVTNIDTFLRPYLMRGAAGVPTVYIFLSVLGGIKVFGPLGLLYGPMIMTLVVAMLRIYSTDYRELFTNRPPEPAAPEFSTASIEPAVPLPPDIPPPAASPFAASADDTKPT